MKTAKKYGQKAKAFSIIWGVLLLLFFYLLDMRSNPLVFAASCVVTFVGWTQLLSLIYIYDDQLCFQEGLSGIFSSKKVIALADIQKLIIMRDPILRQINYKVYYKNGEVYKTFNNMRKKEVKALEAQLEEAGIEVIVYW